MWATPLFLKPLLSPSIIQLQRITMSWKHSFFITYSLSICFIFFHSHSIPSSFLASGGGGTTPQWTARHHKNCVPVPFRAQRSITQMSSLLLWLQLMPQTSLELSSSIIPSRGGCCICPQPPHPTLPTTGLLWSVYWPYHEAVREGGRVWAGCGLKRVDSVYPWGSYYCHTGSNVASCKV